MFTGLVEKTAAVTAFKKNSQGAIIEIGSSFNDLKIGDSIAVNGVCQTITTLSDNRFSIQAMNETLNLTNLASLKTGDIVNLERAMPATGRFGGHFVSGHVDGTAKLLSTREDGFSTVFKFEFDTKYIIKKGSIAINGVSLTVNTVGAQDFEVNLIPHSLEKTNLAALKIGDRVNIEVDMLAKYVEKFMRKPVLDGGLAGGSHYDDTKRYENFLKEHGFV